MRRRKQVDEVPNRERWLISYADFITLLFAFFVVMYAMSSVNEGKYRVLSHSLDSAFGEGDSDKDNITDEHEWLEGRAGIFDRSPSFFTKYSAQAFDPKLYRNQMELPDDEQRRLLAKQRLDAIENALNKAVNQFVSDGSLSINRDSDWIEVEMKSHVLFGSGDADLASTAMPMLRKLSTVLRSLPNALQVEGFTDDLPIDTIEYPSNWELSAARAASVVHVFERLGVDASRMAAVGYGEYHSIADNKTSEGRQANRRVVLVFMPPGRARYSSDHKSIQSGLVPDPITIQ